MIVGSTRRAAVARHLAAIATAQNSDLAGLTERGSIGLYVLWLMVVGWSSRVVAAARVSGETA